MTPAGPTPSDEQKLDDVLANIDKLAEHVEEKAKTDRQKKPDTPPPTRMFSRANYKKTKAAFQELSKTDIRDLLSESKDDSEETTDLPASKDEKPRRRAATG